MPQPLRGFAMTSFFINFRAMQQRPPLARMTYCCFYRAMQQRLMPSRMTSF
ncbi:MULTISPECIES: hypothetical protein [unclassified Rickettsia]|uniref:hypothetical protein n=1 Tax=unclassified Rickettsia TaxID=114295 RepID=UPI003133487D